MSQLSTFIGGSGSGKVWRFRTFNADNTEEVYDLPLFLPGITSSGQDYSTTGNVTFDPGIYYFKDFTINSGHQLTLSAGITVLYCSGNVTIGGNGITGVSGSGKSIINLRNYAINQTISHGTGGANGATTGADGGDGTGTSAAGGGGGGSDGANRTGGDGGTGSDTHGAGGGGCGNSVSGASGGNGSSTGAGGNGGNGGAGGTAGTFGGNCQSSLFIIAKTITITSDINFNGGNGTAGGAGTSGGGGGGGGNGGDAGVVGLFANVLTHTSGNITTNGGDAGNGGAGSAGTASDGAGGGGAGGAGGDAGMVILQGNTLTLSGGTRTSTAGTAGTGGAGGSVSGETGGDGGDGTAGFIDTNSLLNLQVITGSPF